MKGRYYPVFFPISLKKVYTPEELLDVLNQKTWADGGKFEIVKPERLIQALAMGYITYTPCEDDKFAVTVSCFNINKSVCKYIKAEITDLSTIKERATADAMSTVVGNVAGNLGHIAMGVASGSFSKTSDAKKLVKSLNKELKAFVKENGL